MCCQVNVTKGTLSQAEIPRSGVGRQPGGEFCFFCLKIYNLH